MCHLLRDNTAPNQSTLESTSRPCIPTSATAAVAALSTLCPLCSSHVCLSLFSLFFT